MITFLLKSSLCLALLLIFFLFFLENEKINHFKRWFLWFSIMFSIGIPFVTVNSPEQILPINLDEISVKTTEFQSQIQNSSIGFESILLILYLAGCALFLFRFVKHLSDIYVVIKNNNHQRDENYTIILLTSDCLPHTFLNYIFLNENAFQKNEIPLDILNHEKTHARQWHSIDIVLIEILKIIFWFNPIFQAYKKAMQRNHEFLSDENVVKNTNDIATYQAQLLQYAQPSKTYILSSNINYLLTKKRFIMMTKNVSTTKIYAKQLGLLFLFATLTMLLSTKSFAQEKNNSDNQNAILTAVDVKPEYVGGVAKFYKFFMKEMKIPSNFKGKGKLQMSFVVEKDGSLTDIKVIKDDNTNLGDEATAVLQKSPKWIPGMQDGKVVRVEYKLPISIVAN